MKYLRYKGEFISIAGDVWRADILQEATEPFPAVGELEFDADQPLVIDWAEKSKEEVICGAVATLKIISPGDRTYIDLYSVEVGRIQLNVYKNNLPYWSGTIDTEFYEEPYESASGYTVALTFSDFGVLDRLKYEGGGVRTAYELLAESVQRCGLSVNGIDQTMISTSLSSAGSHLSLMDISLRSDNFYDEDGEAMSLAEVVEGVLQPLGLRVVQCNGRIYVYDLNGLYTVSARNEIIWDGATQNLGVDVVYNNAKITWSTYAQRCKFELPDCFIGETSVKLIALNSLEGKTLGDLRYFSYHYSTEFDGYADASDSGFTFWEGPNGSGATLMDAGAKFFRIVAQNDGTEKEGVALKWDSVQYYYKAGQQWIRKKIWGCQLGQWATGGNAGPIVFKSSELTLPPVADPSALNIRITLDMLLDCRFNPYENAVNWADTFMQKDLYDKWKKYGNYVYVPVTVKFQPAGSSNIYCWTNKSVITRSPESEPVKTIEPTLGEWILYTENDAAPENIGYLAWYNPENRTSDTGVLGWKQNRPAINPHVFDLSTGLAKSGPGQYIPYPTASGSVGGKIWVEVRRDSWLVWPGQFSPFGSITDEQLNAVKDLWAKKTWVIMGLPVVEVVNSNMFDREIDGDDVEYNAEINPGAREALELSTICGTAKGGVPTAHGVYFNTSHGGQITEFTRAGRTSQAEELLIGTLYSQYAERKIKLSGEAKLLDTGVVSYEDAAEPGKLFMKVADTQDVRMDTSTAVFTEFRPDEYNKKL